MRKTAFTEEQIAYTLRQAEAGTAVGEICRKLGISRPRSVEIWRVVNGRDAIRREVVATIDSHSIVMDKGGPQGFYVWQAVSYDF